MTIEEHRSAASELRNVIANLESHWPVSRPLAIQEEIASKQNAAAYHDNMANIMENAK